VAQKAHADVVEAYAEPRIAVSPAAEFVRNMSDLPGALRDLAEAHESALSGGRHGAVGQI